jgi:hypothetical protein
MRIGAILEEQYSRTEQPSVLLSAYTYYRKAWMIDEDNEEAEALKDRLAKLLDPKRVDEK